MRKTKQNSSPMKYKGGRFDKTRYQNRAVENIPENEQDLYEVDVEALQKAKWNKNYSKFNIDQLLLDQGFNLNTDLQRPEWVPIYHYENKNLDHYTEDELTQMLPLPARAISKVDNKLTFQNCTVEEYDQNDERFIVIFQNNQKRSLKRIYICFDKEDPRLFSQRLSDAHKRRLLADSLIRNQYYIEHMPINQKLLPQQSKIDAIRSITHNSKWDSIDPTPLIQEIQEKYAMTLNQITFQKCMEEGELDMLPHNLEIPSKSNKNSSYYGFCQLDAFKGIKEIQNIEGNQIIQVEPQNFNQNFKDICFKSLYVKNESVKAIQEIKGYCEDVLKNTFFNVNIDHKCRLEEFKNSQDLYISHNTFSILKMNWPTQIFSTIQKQFGSITSGQYKISDNLDDFEKSKLKKFLLVVKILMQNTISQLTRKSYIEFVNYIKERVPVQTIIEGVDSVKNIYQDGSTKTRDPIFLVDILKSLQNNEFIYSSNPQFYKTVIMTVFDKAAMDIQKFQNVESKVINELIKNSDRKENILKVPFIPKKNPEEEPSETLQKKILNQENAWLWKLREELKDIIAEGVKPLDIYLQTFDIYKDILSINPIEFAESMNNPERPKEIHEIQSEIKKVQLKTEEISQKLPESIVISCFQVQCKDLQQMLLDKYKQINKNLKDVIARRVVQSNDAIYTQILQILHKVRENPKDIEELTALKEYMLQVPMELEKIQEEIKKCSEIYETLEEFQYSLSSEDINKRWVVFKGPKDISDTIAQRMEILNRDSKTQLGAMKLQQEEFKDNIENIEKIITGFHQYKNINMHMDVAKIARNINDQLKTYQEQAKLFNSREMLFEVEVSDYSILTQLTKQFQPYSNLWLIASDWAKNLESWLNNSWDDLDAPAAEKFVEDSLRVLIQTSRQFKEKDIPQILKISEQVKGQLEEFRPKVPLMVALRKQGMKERHWQNISDKTGKEVKPGPGFTFQTVLDMGLMTHVQFCVEIGEKAAKEFQIETMLNQMTTIWQDINFELNTFKNTFIIKNYDDINQILDEHIVNTQTMQFSPYKKPFEAQILDWYQQIKMVSDILEVWAKTQGQYMYLQPIFDSADIMKQLPGETKKFKAVDQIWKNSINMAKIVQNVLKVCQHEGLLERLNESNANLEIVQKELNNYLEKKREKFARFYFLANDELLEILSQTKEPTAVQPHLNKVFENIQEVEFDPSKKILAMISAEKEKIDFVKPVNPVGKPVEDWMNELENMMKLTVRSVMNHGVDEYVKVPRKNWVQQHPGQVVLNASQVLWTYEVEESFKDGVKGVKTYWEKKLEMQLKELVILVRTKLTRQVKMAVNALIVIDVHAKDVVENLWQKEISDINSFEWISQLRYYVIKEKLWVRCVQTEVEYGCEYLGNSMRLVITPLTDKCYITLMGAFNLNLGGAPQGPAGTGKTESTKDLAKAVAIKCNVFNCSDSMDFQQVAKFFKGLASCGAWICFDEFNRINIEVLSVIAQQLLILFGAKAEGVDRIENFEGSDIKMLSSFCVFITMNPGYAGRSELPDNLKALFRPMAMMVPDYAMIGEILFYSFGFESGRGLAIKMVSTFNLSSKQLSNQSHYDYGMRAVRSVINAAGPLKEKEPDLSEEQILLRALREVNVPKFLKDDIPLFENIIKDIFPGVVRPKVNYGNLNQGLINACAKFNLQPTSVFINKIFELYDTICVRHGLMLVGPTGGGKSQNWKVLQEAITSIAISEQNSMFTKVQVHALNPKSIKMGQLYGEFNEMTREWTDGILAFLVRESVKDLSGEKHWILFDGPVDAIWIESMNTVLDDNKKLCLNSGQILSLTPYMTMFFEVEDLSQASPATVSRCGMVYMEPGALGYQPLIDSWFIMIPESFKQRKNFIPSFKNIFATYLDKLLVFMRKNLKEMVQTITNNQVSSMLRILNSLFTPYIETEVNRIDPSQLENFENNLEAIFIYSVIWSIGCTTDYDGRVKFSAFLLDLLHENKSKFIPNGFVYDYNFNIEKGIFYPWAEDIKNFQIDKSLQYSEIVVPTPDSHRNITLMKLLLQNGYHVLCVGPTGTGKSQNAYNMLQTKMGETYQFIAITFSAQTSENQTQDTIDSKTDKRRRGIYGPPLQKKLIIFVDDLNMPKKETYGAQPPIEILRQFLDYKGWYNRKELVFRLFEDMVMFSAMGPPGGGRSVISSRMVRQFNLLTYTELDDGSIKSIFNSLTNHFFSVFNEGVKEFLPTLIDQVLIIYEKVRKELLPTPTKSHYLFNLRDISKVFQGVCLAKPSVIGENADLIRIWYHENMRVFHDRLIDDADRIYFKKLLTDQIKSMGIEESVVLNAERIIYGDFFDGKDGDVRIYKQFVSSDILIQKLYEFQEEFNAEYGKKGMQLILFLDACEHITRITRILRQPMGNALLLGVGGSGRQSLSRLSCFIANQKIFQIEVVKSYTMKSWRDDMKSLLMQAGVENKQITFLFVDTQIIYEQMLEDINNILNSGDITNLYQEADNEEITSACKAECMQKGLQPNKMNIFSVYISRVKKNIHIIICMSPVGDSFTTRLRMFPSLVNCCTLDWFCEWPEDALLGVGRGQLLEEATKQGIEDQLPKLCEMFKRIHKSVEKTSKQFKEELRRVCHVTPKSFLEQLSLYKIVLDMKVTEMKNSVQRLRNGLNKLEEANIEVAKMQIMLKEKQPKLIVASEETEKMLVIITVDKQAAAEKQEIVSVEEAEATKQTQEAEKIKLHVETSVSKANADLAEIIQKVNLLTDAHIGEIRTALVPSNPMKVILGGLVILNLDYIKQEKNGKVIQKPDPDNPFGKKQNDYFTTAKTYLLNEPKVLLQKLKTYEKEKCNPALIAMLEKEIMISPDYNATRAGECSLAISFIYLWTNAIYTFHTVFQQTQPLRDELRRVQAIVDEKTALLRVKKAELEEINNKLQELETALNEKVAYKKQLQDDIQDCIVKLERAQKLVSGLSEEQKRWGFEIEAMEKNGENIVANCLVAAGMISYAGPFTSIYRQRLEKNWIESLIELELKHTPNVTMRDFMGVPVVIQVWNLCGLPKDDTSTENGIIIEKSRRFSLMIDPQNQANKFIKNLGKERPEGIEVVKASDVNIIRICEKAIQFGQWVLLENVQQELDASLEPILQQDIKKSGSGYTIQLGEKQLNYDERFKIYLTTTISNPLFSPETSVKVTIINFAITPSGLEEQMLAQIVAIENPQLEFKKSEIVKRNATDRKELLKIEDSILKSLSEISDINDMLKDETMIDQLANSKKFASEINQRVAESKITEKEIDLARESFRPVAFRASLLFFCILDLSNIDPMYQYSLQWYIKLFQNGVQNSPTSNEHEQRLFNLNSYFTYSLYENVCRSLFEKHKLLFSFLLCNKILTARGDMDQSEWRFMLVGAQGDLGMEKNPVDWIADTSWTDIYLNIAGMSNLDAFQGFKEDFLKRPEAFRHIYDSNKAHEEQLPEPYETSLNQFQKLLLLKCLRPDKLIPGIQNFIASKLGKDYIISPAFDLSKCYRDSAIEIPLIFVLSPGSDPVADFKRFAEEQGMNKRQQMISLGQGQGPKAEKMIREEQVKGGWVLLQNCHLSISWAPVLEKLVEELNDQLHRDFRLWLTSMPDPQFPISVLQNSVKMTLEPPKGLRSNLLRSYQNLDDKELNSSKNPEAFKKLLFGFCIFHAVIQERRKFGPIGWNVSYDFTNEDLNVCKKQLKIFLDEYDEIPYKVINYLGAEINYGGRVTNDKDKVLILEIIQTYIRPEALQDGYAYSSSGIYYSPPAEDQQSYLRYIEGLPLNVSPEVFGMHDNADITNAQNETRDLLQNVLSVQPRESSTTGKTREQIIEDIAVNIQNRTPKVYDIEDVFKQYPTEYKESMNTVLIQECIRYNGILKEMKSSLILLNRALKGFIVMSDDLEKIANALYSNAVPIAWEKKSFNSLKPLSSWIDDINARIDFINSWIENGTPNHYWISGFFFPQAFITGVMQNYARKYTIAVDQIDFNFLFMDQLEIKDIHQKPEDGCYIYGLFFEGAQWNKVTHLIDDSKPKELYSEVPIIQMVPIQFSKKTTAPTKLFLCPLYKTVSRKGELSTTGHCTNFVMFFEVPTDREPSSWIKSGSALFLALRY